MMLCIHSPCLSCISFHYSSFRLFSLFFLHSLYPFLCDCSFFSFCFHSSTSKWQHARCWSDFLIPELDLRYHFHYCTAGVIKFHGKRKHNGSKSNYSVAFLSLRSSIDHHHISDRKSVLIGNRQQPTSFQCWRPQGCVTVFCLNLL